MLYMFYLKDQTGSNTIPSPMDNPDTWASMPDTYQLHMNPHPLDANDGQAYNHHPDRPSFAEESQTYSPHGPGSGPQGYPGNGGHQTASHGYQGGGPGPHLSTHGSGGPHLGSGGPHISSHGSGAPHGSGGPHLGSHGSGGPHLGPPNGSQGASGPPNCSQGHAGPPNSSQGHAGPPNSSQPTAGPPNSSQATAGLPNSSQATAGPPHGSHSGYHLGAGGPTYMCKSVYEPLLTAM